MFLKISLFAISIQCWFSKWISPIVTLRCYIWFWILVLLGTTATKPLLEPILIARFMRPTWGPSGADRTQGGPMLAPWSLLSGNTDCHKCDCMQHISMNLWVFFVFFLTEISFSWGGCKLAHCGKVKPYGIKPWSMLVEIMTCYLTAPSHCLNQC